MFVKFCSYQARYDQKSLDAGKEFDIDIVYINPFQVGSVEPASYHSKTFTAICTPQCVYKVRESVEKVLKMLESK